METQRRTERGREKDRDILGILFLKLKKKCAYWIQGALGIVETIQLYVGGISNLNATF